MKKLALLGAIAALTASVLSGPAAAGTVSGVVVGKDPARHSLAVASRGEVQTVRTARFAKLRVGNRLVATGSRLADGTFAARSVRPGGRVERVRFGAVVVRHEAAQKRLIVSAGGIAFPLRLLSGRAPASSGPGLAAGDKIKVTADVEKGGLEAGKADVKEVGQVELLKLGGIFLWKTKTGFDIAVVKRGLVHVRVPDGVSLPELAAGDIVLVVVSVAGGAFTYVGGHSEGKPGGDKSKEEPREAIEVAGVLAERSAGSLSVVGDGSTVVCAVPAGMDLSLFPVGDKVKVFCKRRADGLVLHWLKSDRAWIKDDGRGEAWFAGTLAETPAVTVTLEDGSLLTCPLLARPVDLSAFRAGDKVKLTCSFAGGKLAFAAMKSERAWINADGSDVGASGVLTSLSGGSIAVQRLDGASLTCALPAGLDLAGIISTGQKATLGCRLREGTLTFASLQAGELTLKADGTGERWVYGVLAERGADTVTVRREDGSLLSCAAPGSIDLSAFAVGDKLKMGCRLLEGTWRLALLRSEKAQVEIPK